MRLSCLKMHTFASGAAFEIWLAKNHGKSPGIWVRFFKKASTRKGVTYAEALDAALCYGWIDSQAAAHDEVSHKQRFTPRGPKSMWSKKNRGHVARLIKEKRMTKAGLEQVQAAKKDGRWASAY